MSGSMFAMRRNVVVAASAGTGKTFHLVGALVHLLLGQSGAPVDPSRIVATTFSRKAAAEIRERLVVELERLSGDPASSPYREGLRALSDRALASRARVALASADRAEITTLHGLAHRLARSHALELGCGADFTLVEDDESARITRDAVLEATSRFADERPDEALQLLSLFKGADRLVDGVLRVLSDLEEMGVPASRIRLPEGDTEAIEREMRDVIEATKALATERGYEDASRAVEAAWANNDDASLVAALFPLFTMRRTKGSPPAAHAFWDLRDELSGSSNAARASSLVARFGSRATVGHATRALRDLVVVAEEATSHAMRRAQAMSFGGVLRAARDLLLHHPAIASAFGRETDALLVDELQDTSRIQRDLILLFWQNDPGKRAPGTMPTAHDARPRGLFVVGDRKQSIYGFRGADVGVFTELCISFAGEPARAALRVASEAVAVPLHPNADFFALQDNYRSAPELMAFSNAFAAARLRAATRDVDEIEFSPQTESLRLPPSRARDMGAPRVTWMRPSGERRKTTRVDDARTVARIVVETASVEKRSWNDFAVLAFSNEMLDATAHALAGAKVPYVVAGRGFYQAQEVRDLCAMLRALVSPRDKRALLSVLRGPWAAAGDATLVGLTEPHVGITTDMSRWGRSERRALIDPEEWPAIERARTVIETLRASLHRLGPGGALRMAVLELGLEETLLLMPRGEQRVANVRKFLSMADRERDARALLRRLEWADRVSREPEAAVFSEDDDAVRLLTIHASKGLDFRVVIIPEVGSHASAPSNLPLILSRASQNVGSAMGQPTLAAKGVDESGRTHDLPSHRAAMSEERRRSAAERHRLLYVAVTRASERMFFVGNGKAEGSLAATLQELILDPSALLAVEEAVLGPPPVATTTPSRSVDVPASAIAAPLARRLPIAATALRDFEACPRRFELLHLVGVPEPGGTSAEAREEGSLVHRVLERVPKEAFGSTDAPAAALDVVSRQAHWLSDEAKGRIVDRACHFLESDYARKVATAGATVLRELEFVVQVGERPTTALRGTMDLLVVWPKGGVDVLDYKSGAERRAHAVQLDAYGLAAQSAHSKQKIRVGIVPLGGEQAEPRFRSAQAPEAVSARLAELGARVARARAEHEYPGVAIDRCRALQCGFVGWCHARTEAAQLVLFR